MALSYSIDEAEQLVTITGEYSAASEWHDLLGRILADPRRRPGFAFLRDLREATRPVDAATVVGIISVVRQFWPHLRPTRAAILTRNDIDSAAMVAHALADAENLPLQAFNSHDAAMAWLRGEARP
jgi:hypothetical protein